MALKKMEMAREMEGIIDSLDEARNRALLIDDVSETDFQDSDIDSEMAEEIEGTDAALLIAENRIDELAQVMGEEIENLRRLLEILEDDL
jgi:vacuolar-type H+-ATPase subunit I/STV1